MLNYECSLPGLSTIKYFSNSVVECSSVNIEH